jgi:uncharacterized membrane protein
VKALSRRTLTVALLVAVALNVLLAGALVAPWVVGHRLDRGHGFRGPGGPVALLRDLAGPEAVAIGERYEPMLRERMDAARAARGRVAEALAAEPFDQAAFEAALSEMRAASGAAKGSFDALLIEVVPTLTPDQRHALADRLFRRFAKPPEE